ncbi:MAG: hypothetical protein NT066_07230 [Candidatus Omnitrophica bacterium]|nr:hypothetical protein [Candidatus Omnitrophota bacterium]
MKVYPLAPADINQFFTDSRFKDKYPEIVILECGERALWMLPEIKKNKVGSFLKNNVKACLKKNQQLVILFDRICKMRQAAPQIITFKEHELLKKIEILIVGAHKAIPVEKTGKILFYGHQENNTLDRIDSIVQKIKSYKKALNNRGIRFIFFPLPDKETIYWEELQVETRPVFLKQLINKLKNEGIEVIDTEEAFENMAMKDKILLYQTDDTHWNCNGVKLAVEVTMGLLRKQKISSMGESGLVKTNISN